MYQEGILIFRISGNFVKKWKFLAEIFLKLKYMVFLKTPGGEFNCKLIRSDFEVI